MTAPRERQGNVLIVDDVPANLEMLATMLGQRGYQVRPVSDGPTALEAVRAAPPDLILLDVKMPEMDGYEVCQRLKADEGTRDIPVIFVSALDETEDKIKGFAVGGVDYITHPFRLEEMLVRVETHLSLRKAREQLQEQNAQLERKIAERVQVEEALRQHAERLKIMHEIGQSMLVARSPETIAMAAVGRMGRLIPCQRVMVFQVVGTGQVKTLAVESTGELTPSIEEEIYRELGQSLLREGQVLGVEDLTALTQRSPAQEELCILGVRAYVIVPLRIHGEVVGMLNLEATRPNVFTVDHINVANEISALLAVAIRQARLYEQSQQEIAERKQAEQALEAERNLLRTLIDNLPDLILAKDPQGRFTLANVALAQLAGAPTPDDMLGKTEFDFVSHEIAAQFQATENEILRTGEPMINHLEQTTDAEGSENWLLTTKVPLRDINGEITGLVGIGRDITARVRVEEALRESEEKLRRYATELEAQNAELDAFAHTVAHNLKNPLTSLMGYSKLLERFAGRMSEERLRQNLQAIGQSSRKMNNIIDELLLLASVREMGEIEMQSLDMGCIVAETQERLAYLIEEHQAEIALPEQWPVALGYAPWVEEVWVNYISNALKYGGRPPYIELGALVRPEPSVVCFWVRDNGLGLSLEEQARLFTPFERLHQVHTKGHGLGLSIVRRIVEKLNGQVGVQSPPTMLDAAPPWDETGEGSVFYFTLPVVA